jgi:hypothetical protein
VIETFLYQCLKTRGCGGAVLFLFHKNLQRKTASGRKKNLKTIMTFYKNKLPVTMSQKLKEVWNLLWAGEHCDYSVRISTAAFAVLLRRRS